MNLPASFDDPSLLQHEPLLTYITVYEQCESRLRRNAVVADFVKAMRENDKAVLAAKRWVMLAFEGSLSDEPCLEVTDNGEQLYTVFFEFQVKLSRGQRNGNVSEVLQYQSHLVRNGIGVIKLKDCGPNARGSTRSKKGRRRAGAGNQHPRQGDIVTSSSPAPVPQPTTGSLAEQQGSPSDMVPGTTSMQLSLSAVAAKPSKRSTSKAEKKRKYSSQKPPAITPSDASEDDKEPSGTREASVASSTSHRSKRIASNPSCQPSELLGADVQAITSSAHEPETMHQTGCFQLRSSLASWGSDNSVSRSGKRHARPLPSHPRRNDERVSSVSRQNIQTSLGLRKPRKARSASALPTRPTKRLCCPSVVTLNDKPGEVTKPAPSLEVWCLQEPATQKYLVTSSSLIKEDTRAEGKGRKKRTRPEFETVLHEDTSVDSYEPLGPDVRSTRPLPRRVRKERLTLVVGKDSAICGVPCGASPGSPSLECADRLLRDAASNALAPLQEGVGPDIPDWTQDKEQDAECDDIDGHDEDEADDTQVAGATSAAPTATPKPFVPAPPRIWAQSRQEVCESFEYFRSYHSGVYSKDDIVKGYLLGAYAAHRDKFYHNGRLIISHGGGKSESILDPRGGPKRFQTDQDQEASDKSVRALLKTWKERRPLVLLADDKYALFPYDLTSGNYTYVVLGLYWISHAWAECQPARDGSGRIVRWKFAFQWCEGQGNPWWEPHQDTTNVTPGPLVPISNSRSSLAEGSPHLARAGGNPSVQCETCQEQSPFVYKEGWMCLNPRCNVFWTINGEEPKELDYREEFLALVPQKFERLPKITPARVVETRGGVTTTYAFSKGWHCIECGRLSCRFKWEHWECSNCKFKHVVGGRVRISKEFWHQRPPKEFMHSRIGKDSGIVARLLEPINLGVHKGHTNRLTFILPYDRGKIHLILGTPLSNGNADNIFQLYQQQASTGELKLRRYPLRNHRARGLLLTNYFSQNSGEPYQYVGGTGNTVPFHEAPDCVRRALAVIKERSRLALGTDIPFNEILSAAYMERQKMSFHSDSERGLGPVVASLSLGSAALMHFRPHVNVDNLKGKSAYALTLVLRHGDVLIMEGEGVQQHYEHTVIPMNFRIAATARCIGSA